ncbi:MAG: nicotinamide riboside transporter PnuC [Saprospiraceae bacterium]
MESIIDFLVEPYRTNETYLIVLEILAAGFGIISVIYSRLENILVYPTGLISTGIYVYLLNIYELRGDMVINAYFFIMSIYGWFNWSRAMKGNTSLVRITTTTKKEKTIECLFFSQVFYSFSLLTSSLVLKITYITYLDSFNTAIFFVAMWYMALKKLENWTLWIIGNTISIPLYLIKGLGFTAIQYTIFLILAILGYIEWKKNMNSEQLVESN